VHPSPPAAEPQQDRGDLIWLYSNTLDSLTDTDVTICLDQAVIHPSDCVRDLGVLLDSSLSMRQHIAKVASTCFFHLRRLRKLRRVLDLQSRKQLVCAFILTHIDYCNAVLANLPDTALAPLQRVLHAAARFVAAIGLNNNNLSCHAIIRSCHADTHFVALATCTSTNRLQTMYHDAFCVLWSGSVVYI